MSIFTILESGKQTPAESTEEFIFTISDYLEPTSELGCTLDAIDVMISKIETLNRTKALLNETPEELTKELSGTLNSILDSTIGVSFPLNANGVLDYSNESAKDKLKSFVATIKALIEKAKNLIVDQIRKFRTGTELLDVKILSLRKKMRDDKSIPKTIMMQSVPLAFYMKGKIATAKDLETLTKLIRPSTLLSPTEGMYLLGNKHVSVEASADKPTVIKVVQEKEPKLEGNEFEKEELYKITGVLSDISSVIGLIDHRQVTKSIEALSKVMGTLSDGKEAVSMLKSEISNIRMMTVDVPVSIAKDVSKIVGAINASIK